MTTASSRERIRSQTREEAKAAALRQIAAAGPRSLSVNAIGKELGISGPALYLLLHRARRATDGADQ